MSTITLDKSRVAVIRIECKAIYPVLTNKTVQYLVTTLQAMQVYTNH